MLPHWIVMPAAQRAAALHPAGDPLAPCEMVVASTVVLFGTSALITWYWTTELRLLTVTAYCTN